MHSACPNMVDLSLHTFETHRSASFVNLAVVTFQCTMLVEGLLDSTPVQGLAEGTRHTLGDHFFTLFRPNVAAHVAMNTDSVAMMMRHAGKDPHRVCSVLVAVLDHVGRDRSLRKK